MPRWEGVGFPRTKKIFLEKISPKADMDTERPSDSQRGIGDCLIVKKPGEPGVVILCKKIPTKIDLSALNLPPGTPVDLISANSDLYERVIKEAF